MRSIIFTIVYLCLSLAGLASAAPKKPSGPPAAPGLSYLYTLNVTAGVTYPVGPGPRGTRVVLTINGGNFAGPKLKGTLMPVGGDFALLDANNPDPNKVFTPDVKMVLETHDGQYIYKHFTGEMQENGDTLIRVGFETGSEKYYWLNSVVGVGTVKRLLPFPSDLLTFDIWKVELPKSK
ncbi:hypothetical protein V8F06_004317 [Rhypophila decipiens]